MPSFLESLAHGVPQLAVALEAHGNRQWEKARAAYLQVIDQPQLTAICFHQLGVIAEAQGDLERAAQLIRTAIRLDSGRPIFHQTLGTILERLGNRAESLDAMMSFALTLYSAGQMEMAGSAYRRVLEIEPSHYGACINLGALLVRDDARAGIPYLVKGIALCAAREPRVRGLIDALLPMLRDARLIGPEIARTSGVPLAEVPLLELGVTNLGVALGQLGFVDEAILCHRLAIEIEPGFADAHFNLSLLLLARGEFRAGWREYEWRWKWKNFGEPRRRFSGAQWRGQDLAGKTILVFTEQGWGDTIQFAPLIRRLAAAAHIILEVPPPLLSLFRDNLQQGAVEVVARKDPNRVDSPRKLDYAVSLMSLAERLDIGLADLPLATGYVRARDDLKSVWRARIGASDAIQVGLVWAGSPTHKNDRNRSIALQRLSALFRHEAITWHSLQVGPQAGEPTRIGAPLRDHSEDLTDFAATAAAIDCLDLVISVDTAVAHLAAAMGKPTWILLPAIADWRWLEHRTDSPWYPSARLFRQPQIGDWDSVVATVSAVVAEFRKG
jgi:tetratricopeptide (TPR) repeat protein